MKIFRKADVITSDMWAVIIILVILAAVFTILLVSISGIHTKLFP